MYAHYVYLGNVPPDGRGSATLNAAPAARSATASARRSPFAPAGSARWTLQFDKSQALQRDADAAGRASGFSGHPDGRQRRRLAAARAPAARALNAQLAVGGVDARRCRPRANSPCSSRSASRSTSRFWITRLSGRAP